jgi:hypothetical protein
MSGVMDQFSWGAATLCQIEQQIEAASDAEICLDWAARLSILVESAECRAAEVLLEAAQSARARRGERAQE